LKIHRKGHALNKIYQEQINNWFMMKNLKIHHLKKNLITRKKTLTKILKTISRTKKMIKITRKRKKIRIKIKIPKKRILTAKNN